MEEVADNFPRLQLHNTLLITKNCFRKLQIGCKERQIESRNLGDVFICDYVHSSSVNLLHLNIGNKSP